MSSVSSTKHEKTSELMHELESVRALNSSLRAYLEHIRLFKKNLGLVNKNVTELTKVNEQWVDTLNMMK